MQESRLNLSQKKYNRLLFSNRNKNIKNNSDYSEICEALNDTLNMERSVYYRYGYECIGPLLFGFSRWLFGKIKELKIEKIFFLSRDGYLMEKAYNDCYNNERKSRYLYVSRKSIHFPLLHKCKSLYEYLSLNGERKRWSYITLCNRLGINPEEYYYIWKNYGFEMDNGFKLNDIKRDNRYENFFQVIFPNVEGKSKDAYDVFIRFLGQNEFSGRIAIVDSGGIGTIQNCIRRIVSSEKWDVKVFGFYLWLYRNPKQDEFVYPVKMHDLIGGETVVTELPLTSHEGSVNGYYIDDNDIVKPRLEEYEYSAYTDIKQKITDIQEGTEDCVFVLKNTIKEKNIDCEVAYSNCMMVSRYPRMFEIRVFRDFFFHSDQEDTYLAKPKSIMYHMFHLKKSIRIFGLTRWKIGYLKALFRLPLPYYSILCTIRRCNKVRNKK